MNNNKSVLSELIYILLIPIVIISAFWSELVKLAKKY